MTDTLDCGRCEELLPDFVEGSLGEPLRTEVARHLEGCASCPEIADGLRAIAEVFAERREPDLPAGLVDRVAAASWAARKVVPLRPVTRMPWHLQVAAALVSITVGGASLAASVAWHDPHSAPGRAWRSASNATFQWRDRAGRVVEDLRLLQLVVSTAFDTRVERVNDRVEDYRRILERRQERPRPASSTSPRKNGQGPTSFSNTGQTELVDVDELATGAGAETPRPQGGSRAATYVRSPAATNAAAGDGSAAASKLRRLT